MNWQTVKDVGNCRYESTFISLTSDKVHMSKYHDNRFLVKYGKKDNFQEDNFQEQM